MKRGSFHIPLYGITVYVRIGKTSESIQKLSTKIMLNHDEDHTSGPIEGLVFTPDNDRTKIYLFLSEQYLTVNTITHETDHIRNNIIEFCGLATQEDFGETSAYLNGYINEQVFKIIAQKGLKIKY